MIRLTIDESMPISCTECPFVYNSYPDLICPSLGNLVDWHAPDSLGTEMRHPECPLEECRKLDPFSFIDKSPKIGGEYLHTLQEDTATSVILCAEKWIQNAADEYCRLERGEE